MDKRLIKTQNAIYEAFTKVLQEKPYSKITIEDILKISGTSRSTFYSHYKTKDELLLSIVNHIFEHVFSHTLTEEKSHDFSKSSIFDYSHLITHILYHLHDEKNLISAILSSESKAYFIDSLKKQLAPITNIIIKNKLVKDKDIPEGLYSLLISDSFIILIEYWFKNNCIESPEVITKYFFEVNS